MRHFLPVLRRLPDKYIYEPWKAPLDVQRAAGCVVGTDYPAPVCDHDAVSKANIARMTAAYAAHRAANGGGGDQEDGEGGSGGAASRKPKKAKTKA